MAAMIPGSHRPSGRPLGEAINAATRPVHAKLNRLILLRLPLVIPPQSPTPSTYVTGLVHIAPIYMAFETLWHRVLEIPQQGIQGWPFGDDSSPEDWPSPSPLPDATRTILQHMLIPGLARSAALRADIQALTGWSDVIIDDQLRYAATAGPLGEFVEHIRQAVEARPHVLLAYAWVLYMALFSGGRFIRATLEAVNNGFWDYNPDPVRPSMRLCQRESGSSVNPAFRLGESDMEEEQRNDAHDTENAAQKLPLAFFRFATPRDGEDLKTLFKKRLLEAESQLTGLQRDDVVDEAGQIFESIIELVEQLDRVCQAPAWGGDGDAAAHVQGSPFTPGGDSRRSSTASLLEHWVTPRMMQLRDSVAVAKERTLRALGLRELARGLGGGSGDGDVNSDVAGEGETGGDQRDGAEVLNLLVEASGRKEGDAGLRDRVPGEQPVSFRAVQFEKRLPVPERGGAVYRYIVTKTGDGLKVQGAEAEVTTPRRYAALLLPLLANANFWLAVAVMYIGYLYLRWPSAAVMPA